MLHMSQVSSSQRSSMVSIQSSLPSLRNSVASSTDSSICSSPPSKIRVDDASRVSSRSYSNHRISMVSFRRSTSIVHKTPPSNFTKEEEAQEEAHDDDPMILPLQNANFRLSVEIAQSQDEIRHTPCDPIMQKRQHIMTEILNTERTYVANLAVLHDNFLVVFVERLATSPILSFAALTTIFSNYVDIYNLSTELLRQLEARLDCWQPEEACVGDILADIVPFFKMYSVYVKNFNSSLQMMETQFKENETFSRFICDHDQFLGGLSFQSHLLKPVQRVPRYKLLFADLLENTPSDHPDHAHLEKACHLTSSIAQFINENIRYHEMLLTMIELQRTLQGFEESLLTPGRQLVKAGGVTKICRRNSQRRMLFLFSDILIYASPSKSTAPSYEDAPPYTFHRKFDLEDITIIASESEPNGFDVITSLKSFSILLANSEEKQEWMEAIRNAKQAILALRRSMRGRRQPKRSVSEPLPKIRMDNLPTIDNYSAPVWIPDSKTDRCMICTEHFHSIFRRKHHCRLCGRLICYACSTRSFRIQASIEEEQDRIERACDTCWNGLWSQLTVSSGPSDEEEDFHMPTPPLTPMKRLSSYFLPAAPPLPSPSPLPQTAEESLQSFIQPTSKPSQQRCSSGDATKVGQSILEDASSMAKRSGHRRESADMSGKRLEAEDNTMSTEKLGLGLTVARPSLVLETHVEVEDETVISPNGLAQVQVKVQTTPTGRMRPGAKPLTQPSMTYRISPRKLSLSRT